MSWCCRYYSTAGAEAPPTLATLNDGSCGSPGKPSALRRWLEDATLAPGTEVDVHKYPLKALATNAKAETRPLCSIASCAGSRGVPGSPPQPGVLSLLASLDSTRRSRGTSPRAPSGRRGSRRGLCPWRAWRCRRATCPRRRAHLREALPKVAASRRASRQRARARGSGHRIHTNDSAPSGPWARG